MPIFLWFNLEAVFRTVAAAAGCALLVFPAAVPAQQEMPGASKIMVGTVEAPPFATKTADGDWEGLSIDLFPWNFPAGSKFSPRSTSNITSVWPCPRAVLCVNRSTVPC